MTRAFLLIAGSVVAVVVVASAAAVVPTQRNQSPPSRSLVYEHGAPLGHPMRGLVWRARVDGRGARALTSGLDPVISPDGRWIAFRRGYHELWLIPAGGGRQRRLRLAPGYISGIVWSPGSTRLAVLEHGGLAIVERESRDARILVRAAPRVSVASVSFSPDGRRLVYDRVDTFGGDLYVVPANGGASRRLTTDRRSFAPVWGPRLIAFSRLGYRGDVWVMRADGSGRRRLTRTNAGIRPVAWSANGQRLLAANPPTHNGRLWAVDVGTGWARDLTGWVGDLFAQGLSRDGKTVLAAIGCGGIVSTVGVLETLPFTGGHATVISRGPCRGNWNA